MIGTPSKYWENRYNRRAFFTQYARANGFDPLVPDNWYAVSKNIVLDGKVFIQRCKIKYLFCLKDSIYLLELYNRELIDALVDLFPNIGLDPCKFAEPSILSLYYTLQHTYDILGKKNYWDSKDNRRKFFEEFAKSNNFDPLSSEQWNSISKSQILQLKVHHPH